MKLLGLMSANKEVFHVIRFFVDMEADWPFEISPRLFYKH
ncbi:hypothetical protein B4134_2726 [Bacillus safensis]|nr:hypothetical protein B4134_2726 [Bacillus safensis]